MQILSWLPFVLLIAVGALFMAYGGYRKGQVATYDVLKRENCGTRSCFLRYFPGDASMLTGNGKKLTDALFYGGIAVMGVGLLYGRILTARGDASPRQGFGGTIMSSLFGRGAGFGGRSQYGQSMFGSQGMGSQYGSQYGSQFNI